jgi:hypothetical protein
VWGSCAGAGLACPARCGRGLPSLSCRRCCWPWLCLCWDRRSRGGCKGHRFSVAVCAQDYLTVGVNRQRSQNELFIQTFHDSLCPLVYHSHPAHLHRDTNLRKSDYCETMAVEGISPRQGQIKQILSVKMRHDLLPLIGSLGRYFIGSHGTDKGAAGPDKTKVSSGYNSREVGPSRRFSRFATPNLLSSSHLRPPLAGVRR